MSVDAYTLPMQYKTIPLGNGTHEVRGPTYTLIMLLLVWKRVKTKTHRFQRRGRENTTTPQFSLWHASISPSIGLHPPSTPSREMEITYTKRTASCDTKGSICTLPMDMRIVSAHPLPLSRRIEITSRVLLLFVTQPHLTSPCPLSTLLPCPKILSSSFHSLCYPSRVSIFQFW